MTTVAPIRLSMVKPCLPVRNPYPPPTVNLIVSAQHAARGGSYPPTPVYSSALNDKGKVSLTSLTVPPTVAKPKGQVALSTSDQSAPPPTWAILACWSTLTWLRYLERSMTSPPLVDEAPDGLCPPPERVSDGYIVVMLDLPLIAISSPASTANFTAAETSSLSLAKATRPAGFSASTDHLLQLSW